MGPPTKFCGSAGGSRASRKFFTAQKCTKIEIFGQNSAGRAGDWFWYVVSARKSSTIMFSDPKNFTWCSGALRLHMNGSKTDHISKNSKNRQKKLHFYIEKYVFQMTSKCMVCNFFALTELKNKINYQSHPHDCFFWAI